MSKIKQSPKLPAEQRCEQLLKSARELFINKGYRDTTTEEIARRAKLTKGALYYHFNSKEDIIFQLVKGLLDRHLEELDALYVVKGSPGQILELLLDNEDLSGDKGMGENIDFFVQAMRIPRIRRYINRQFAIMIERFAEGIDPKYGSKRELRQMAVLTYSLFHGLKIRKIVDPKIVDVPAQAKLFESLLVGKYGKPERKAKKK